MILKSAELVNKPRGGDYWKAGLHHSGKYPDLDTSAGQYRDSTGAAVAYISPAAISPWSNPVIPTDPGSIAYQARLAHENERNLNIFFAGLGFVGEGFAAINAVSKLHTASEAGNVGLRLASNAAEAHVERSIALLDTLAGGELKASSR